MKSEEAIIPEQTDELYEQALELVVKNKKASTSFLQRSLKIGYSRAARLMDLLEENKVIAEQAGAAPRVVLIDTVPKKPRKAKATIRESHKVS